MNLKCLTNCTVFFLTTFLLLVNGQAVFADEKANYQRLMYNPGKLKPIDSELKVKIGDRAPDFTLPSVQGDDVSLAQYLGKKNVVLTFVPAAWTPVCSSQWPGYIDTKHLFNHYDAVVIGISVDNIPTLYAWTRNMDDLWFPVLSDFWPHGAVSETYGVLRKDGTAERALIVIDKQGVVRNVQVGDINVSPTLDFIVKSLAQLNNKK